MALVLDGNGTMTVGNGDITGITRGAIESTAIGSGAVLQVVQGVLSSGPMTTSTSYSDTGLTVSISPTSTTSKILVLATVLSSAAGSQGVNSSTSWNIVRNSTQLIEVFQRTYSYAGGGIYTSMPTACSFLDSPSTTSSTTYKVQFKCNSAANMYVNGDGGSSVITVVEIAA
jgi:hypothetical protein